MLKIAIIGDRFVHTELVENLLLQHLRPVTREFSTVAMEVGWPDDTPVNNDELHEFVGDPAAIARFVDDAHVIVTQVAPVSRALIEQAQNLQIIACGRGGPVSVNIAAATAHHIPVAYAPGANTQAVVEFTLGLILAECKSIARVHRALVDDIWRGDLYHYEKSPRELQGQTVGLVGFGSIGRGLVPYLKPFGVRILFYDPYCTPQEGAALGAEKTDLSTLLQEADIVSLHARVTPETRGMMGTPEFAQMKRGATFINTARGPLVDYDALYNALNSGHLGGAALDTFAIEPPPASWPLLKLDNVTLTPHIAGSSRQTARRKAEIVIGDVANFYAGRPLLHCANPEVLEKEKR